MRVRFLRIAQIELDSAVEYLNAERKGSGYRFLREVLSAISRAENFPHAWQSLQKGTRRVLIRRFPYGVVYKVIDDLLLIVAIAHLHREPEYWIGRIDEILKDET